MSYCPHSDKEIKEMLAVCGVSGIENLFADINPGLRSGPLALEKGISEFELMREMGNLAAKCPVPAINFTGGGFYDHFIPSAVDALSQMEGFLTAYTPYQSECSQGTLQALYEYQSAICRLTGMAAANASVYDGGTALAEAVIMALRKSSRRKIVIDGSVNPLYRDIIRTYFSSGEYKIIEIAPSGLAMDRERFKKALDGAAAVVIQNPNFFGTVEDFSDVVKAAHAAGALAIGSFYPMAMAVLKTPAEADFDIATGEGQSLGIPLSFGGPYLGYIACTQGLVRNLPGRIAGAAKDEAGRRGFVLTLQAREQHIRRERASSNICSNQNLCALRALIYLALVGKRGFVDISLLCRDKSEYAKERLGAIPGLTIKNTLSTFNEFVFESSVPGPALLEALAKKGIAAGIALGAFYKEHKNSVLVSFTEKSRKEDIDFFAERIEEFLMEAKR